MGERWRGERGRRVEGVIVGEVGNDNTGDRGKCCIGELANGRKPKE